MKYLAYAIVGSACLWFTTLCTLIVWDFYAGSWMTERLLVTSLVAMFGFIVTAFLLLIVTTGYKEAQ